MDRSIINILYLAEDFSFMYKVPNGTQKYCV